MGGKLTVFDGQGREALGVLEDAGKNTASVRLLQESSSPPLRCEITLAQAIPKGKNMDFIIQKAVELGASRIAPLLSDRTIIRLNAQEAVRKQEKWTQIAIEACKQCGQNHLPLILRPQTPAEFLDQTPASEWMLIASLQPDARHIKDTLNEWQKEHGHRPSSVTVLVGPEGDFTPAEIALAKSRGCQPVTLGPIILRTETAAMYCLSVLAHELF